MITISKNPNYLTWYSLSLSSSGIVSEERLVGELSAEQLERLKKGEELHFKLVEVERIRKLEQFIKNGVKFGYITIPEEGDPARDIIDEIIGDK